MSKPLESPPVVARRFFKELSDVKAMFLQMKDHA